MVTLIDTFELAPLLAEPVVERYRSAPSTRDESDGSIDIDVDRESDAPGGRRVSERSLRTRLWSSED